MLAFTSLSAARSDLCKDSLDGTQLPDFSVQLKESSSPSDGELIYCICYTASGAEAGGGKGEEGEEDVYK